MSVYVESLKRELAEHKAAGREDRAAECIAEIKRAEKAAGAAEKATAKADAETA